MIKVNGVDISTPKTFEVVIQDLDGEQSSRDQSGNMHRDRVAVKRKLQLEWPPLTQNEISTLLTAVSGVFFSVTYPDPQAGTVTKTMYVGDRTSPAYQYKDGVAKWSGLKMDFIEQ